MGPCPIRRKTSLCELTLLDIQSPGRVANSVCEAFVTETKSLTASHIVRYYKIIGVFLSILNFQA